MSKIDLNQHWKKMFDYEYLGAYSLADSDDEEKANFIPVNVTITTFEKKMVKKERGTEECLVTYFNEKVGDEHKPMIVNKTNSKILEDLFRSPIVKSWIGKKVQLYVDKNVKGQGGEITKGLRFQDAATPIVQPKPKKKPSLNPKHPKWKDARANVLAGKITIEKIKKHFSITDANAKKLQKPE